MKRALIILVIVLVSAGWFPHGNIFGFFTLPLGSGGWSRDIDINADGTRIDRTDTNGCFIQNGTWQQLITQAAWPSANFGYVPNTGTSQVNQFTTGASGVGCYAAASAPSLSSVVYVAFNAGVFVSTNKGATFVNTGFSEGVMQSNGTSPSTSVAAYGPKMAIDPANPDVVYIGTDADGMFMTANGRSGASATWNAVSAVATSATGAGYNIDIDPASGTTASCPNSATLCTKTIAAYGDGNTGVSFSFDGGNTFSIPTGGPTHISRMAWSQSGDVLWAVGQTASGGSGSGAIYQYIVGCGGTPNCWTNVSTGSSLGSTWWTVAPDPAHPTTRILLATSGGTINIGTVSGTSVTLQGQMTPVRSATDVPWLAKTNEIFMTAGNMVFDPSLSNTIVFAEGIGVWTFQPPGSGSTYTPTSITAGIEQLVTNQIIAPNGVPIVGVWDRMLFSNTNLATYPANQLANQGFNFSIMAGWGLDWATSNTNFIASRVQNNNNTAEDMSSFSSDGGVNWHVFNTWDATVTASGNVIDCSTNSSCGSSCGTGHCVEFTVPSTTGLVTWAPGTATPMGTCECIMLVRPLVIGVAPSALIQNYFYLAVVDSTHVLLQGTTFTNAMASTSGLSWYLAINSNPMSNWNGDFNITGVVSSTGSAGGLIKVTVTSGQSINWTGIPVCIVSVTGTTEANGCWVATFVSNGVMTLNGSNFQNAYVSGGVLAAPTPPGGYVAASTPLNIITVPSDNDYPYCTTDGGKTWTQLDSGAGATTGWGNAYFTNRHSAAADRVTANTFYLYNFGASNAGHGGTFTVTNCGALTQQSSTILTDSNGSGKLVSVPGNAGHLLFAVGPQGSPGSSHPVNAPLKWSNNSGATYSSVANTAEALAVDAGAIKPGNDYPTVYFVGWLSNVYGVYRSTSNAAAWAANTQTWTEIGDYPLAQLGSVSCISADQTVWNKFYMCMGGGGADYGQFQ